MDHLLGLHLVWKNAPCPGLRARGAQLPARSPTFASDDRRTSALSARRRVSFLVHSATSYDYPYVLHRLGRVPARGPEARRRVLPRPGRARRPISGAAGSAERAHGGRGRGGGLVRAGRPTASTSYLQAPGVLLDLLARPLGQGRAAASSRAGRTSSGPGSKDLALTGARGHQPALAAQGRSSTTSTGRPA